MLSLSARTRTGMNVNNQHPSARTAGHSLPSYTAPLYDTTLLTAALANPYAQHYPSSHMSPHYYQAYLQACSNGPPRTTTDGYTLSSTYVPGSANPRGRSTPTTHTSRPSLAPTPSPGTVKPVTNHLTHGSWYQPGNCRCTRQGCPFTGSRKSVEIHMMDRHFVFPPGWAEKEKEKEKDWDADPSLRGKPIAIQGTSLLLDTPEAIDAWIAERRRRFPTADKVMEKKRKLEEAVARGQLIPEGTGGARKRHRQDMSTEGNGRGTRGRVHQRGRGHRRECPVRPPAPRTENVNVDDSASRRADAKIDHPREENASTSDDDEAPEVASSKIPTAPLCAPKNEDNEGQVSHTQPQGCSKRIPQPKKPPRNPFATRSMLLRNLLLPEIRITVSNLSQAIHFLVENDFLRDVELRPGEAQEQMIEVLDSSETPCSAPPQPGEPSSGCRPLS